MTRCWVMAIWSFSHWPENGHRTTDTGCDFIFCPMLLCSALTDNNLLAAKYTLGLRRGHCCRPWPSPCHSRPLNDKTKVLSAKAEAKANIFNTRRAATAEKQRSSCACLPRLANWSCNAQNTAESQRLYYFRHSNALIQEVLAENAFCHEIATQGHSRSFILQSFAGRQGVAYRHMGSKRRIFSATEWVLAVQGRWFWYQSKARMRLPISD